MKLPKLLMLLIAHRAIEYAIFKNAIRLCILFKIYLFSTDTNGIFNQELK